MQERLERLTKSVGDLNLEFLEGNYEDENSGGNSECVLVNDRLLTEDRLDENPRISQSNLSLPENIESDSNHLEKHMINEKQHTFKDGVNDDNVESIDSETERKTAKVESDSTNAEDSDLYGDGFVTNKQSEDRRLPNAILPLLRCSQYESSESSCSFQGSPCEDRNFRSDADDTETEEASVSGQEDLNDLHDILEWAKANNCGPLQIISEYYRLSCPARGSSIIFRPLEHLHPLEYHRPDETVLYLAGSTIDLKSCSTGLELAEAHNTLLAEEEATALSIWAVACLCGTLRLEHIEAAKGFLLVLRSYLDDLCCNIRSHTITNVQSNDDKVSLLLKESFIDSFPYRDRPFMKFYAAVFLAIF
ncbi:hypothetical protein SESBI_02144 [Sesbania bispinosa]|nr:hypothetical protein SESBI_02144 [Sesbania bispinosa]